MMMKRTSSIVGMIALLLPLAVQAQHRLPVKRDVAMEGVVNFRDMGGYVTTDGLRVEMGKLYRSGDLSQITDNDLEELKRRKIYTVIDLRSQKESALAPDRLLPGADYLALPLDSWNDSAVLLQQRSGMETMTALYADISHFKEIFRPFFEKLVTLPDTSAILIHSSLGKDRAGIAAALLLYALDIPVETIFSDYAASNFFRKNHNDAVVEECTKRYGIEHDKALQLTEAHPSYLQATFTAIIGKYGSVEAFFNIELGVDEMVKMILRRKFL
ncbi:MAG: tyrosine-protein phosphatase [Bacteroidales bacterium]|jgi:protein-tyrosine phosphatase|nr:tyrosine-protein phosphatase [Bacteroidales bacterium]